MVMKLFASEVTRVSFIDCGYITRRRLPPVPAADTAMTSNASAKSFGRKIADLGVAEPEAINYCLQAWTLE
jgi:hypothetical protein